MSIPFKWASRIRSRKSLESLIASTFAGNNDLCCSNIKYFHRRCLYTKEAPFMKWASHISLKNQVGLSRTSCSRHNNILSAAEISFSSSIRRFCTASCRVPRAQAEAEDALLDYLHNTRGFHFPDAEHMSRNSPDFTKKLLDKVGNEEDVGLALRRFFRYNPINEFEPFFESLGLMPDEIGLLLPRHLMFLCDDEELLRNYNFLCNYGFERGKIGKLYKEATEIFKYETSILHSKLRAYEGLGLSKNSVIKVVASSPSLLIGGVNGGFAKVLDDLEGIGIGGDWIGKVLYERNSYEWDKMPMVLKLFLEMGITQQDLGNVIRSHPDFLLEDSGRTVFYIVMMLLKLGGKTMDIYRLFSQFPCVYVGSFLRNLRQSFQFLNQIEMDFEDIQMLLLFHTEVFGSCRVKTAKTVLTTLNVGKKRLCRILKQDPQEVKKFSLGMKVSPLPACRAQDIRSAMMKKEFLLHVGFVEDSKEMEKALSAFRGKGDELQDRYDFLIRNGISPNDASNMIKKAPHILNQKIDILESKFDFLVNSLGYPLSSLVQFPQCLSFTLGRVKVRFMMYNWLVLREQAPPGLALSSIVACSDKLFMKRFISSDARGPEVWEDFKKEIFSR